MTTRFELVDEGFADPCLTTWPRHPIWSDDYHSIWSGRRGSNSLPPPWQGGALPDELRPHIRCICPCTLPFLNGAPAKICEAKFCGEEEKVWRSSRQSCLQDCTMNSRTFDEATRIGLEPTTPSVTGWCSNQLSYRAILEQLLLLRYGAADEARTRYLHLGKVALYQMSYGRIYKMKGNNSFHLKGGASDRNRTNDTGIFSPLLYRLSYRGAPDDDYYTRNSGFVKRKFQIFLKKTRLFLKNA